MIDLSKYIGLPYEKYDCWQLICHFYKNELGITLPTFEGEYASGYDSKNVRRIYTREMANKIWPKVENGKPYNLVVLRINGENWHAGIMVSKKHMLHIQRGCNSVIERFQSAFWKNRIYGYYRYNG